MVSLLCPPTVTARSRADAPEDDRCRVSRAGLLSGFSTAIRPSAPGRASTPAKYHAAATGNRTASAVLAVAWLRVPIASSEFGPETTVAGTAAEAKKFPCASVVMDAGVEA